MGTSHAGVAGAAGDGWGQPGSGDAVLGVTGRWGGCTGGCQAVGRLCWGCLQLGGHAG